MQELLINQLQLAKRGLYMQYRYIVSTTVYMFMDIDYKKKKSNTIEENKFIKFY